MRVVVTGAAGMIGSNLVHGLNAHRHRRRDRGRRPDRRRRSTATCSARRSATTSTRREFYARFARGEFGQVDAVLHEGACSDTMEHDGRYMLDTNYRCSKDLLDACQAQGTRLLYASSAATYGGSASFREEPQFEQPLNVYGYSQAAVRQRRAAHAAARRRRRWWAFATSTSTARASSTRAAWPRWRSTTSTSSARPARCKLFGEYGGYGPGSSRATSSSSTTWSRSTCGSCSTPRQSGIFNLGTGRAQPFNDVARGHGQRGTRAERARRPCRWPSWCAQGLVEYIAFPDALVGKYQCFTQADLTRLRAAGCEHAFADVASGVQRYVSWLAAHG